MQSLFIDAKRNGYVPDQCGHTMTVAEFISCLQQYDGDLKVYLRNDNGYTYGSITESDFDDEEMEGEE